MNLPSLLTTVMILTSSAAGLVFTDPMDLELLPYQRTTGDHSHGDDCPAADTGDDHGDDDDGDGDSGDDGSDANGTSSSSGSSSSNSNSSTSSDSNSTSSGSSSTGSSSSDSNSTTSDDNSTSSGSSSTGNSGSQSNTTTSEQDEEEASESNETEESGSDDPESDTPDCDDVEDGNETAERGNETAEDDGDEAETEEVPEAAPVPNCAEVHINDSGDDLLGEDRDWSFLVSEGATHLSVLFEGSYGLPGLGGGPDVTLVDGQGRVIASGDSGDGWGGMSVEMAGPMTPGLWTLSYSSEGVLSGYWVSIDLEC